MSSIFGLRPASDNRTTSADVSPYSGLQLWNFTGLRYFVDSLSRISTLGRSSLFATTLRTEYAGFNAAVVLQRDYPIFLLKTLIPLLLLILVVFSTLFLPANLFRERITIPVTAILTSAVLLVAVNNQLGDVGYTVAIELIFYVFFGLCLMTMLVGIAHDSAANQGKTRQATILARSGQLLYAGTVLTTVVLFLWRYGLA